MYFICGNPLLMKYIAHKNSLLEIHVTRIAAEAEKYFVELKKEDAIIVF
jgi:hypothetical protein